MTTGVRGCLSKWPGEPHRLRVTVCEASGVGLAVMWIPRCGVSSMRRLRCIRYGRVGVVHPMSVDESWRVCRGRHRSSSPERSERAV